MWKTEIRKQVIDMSDYMVRATAANGQIRAFAITSKDLVEVAVLSAGKKIEVRVCKKLL